MRTYGAYVTYIAHHGITAYPNLVAEYVEKSNT